MIDPAPGEEAVPIELFISTLIFDQGDVEESNLSDRLLLLLGWAMCLKLALFKVQRVGSRFTCALHDAARNSEQEPCCLEQTKASKHSSEGKLSTPTGSV